MEKAETAQEKQRLQELAIRMRADWNRRVNHDYRFWMSDGYRDDQSMWTSGERDLDILLQDIGNTESAVLLELGCGVGRLLRAAQPRFRKVIGLDVSDKALAKARDLLDSPGQVELLLGDGFSLRPLEDKSIDVAISFASLTSMPVRVIANYLVELRRVLRETGTVRLQLYLGEEHVVSEGDTLHLRCFKPEHFRAAAQAAGFDVEWTRELVLPYQVSFKELGIEAVIVSLKPNASTEGDPRAVESALLATPGGEHNGEVHSALEAWMSMNYAKELVASGEFEKARDALGYAANFAQSSTIDVSDTLQSIMRELERSSPSREETGTEGTELYDENIRLLKQRFPAVASQVEESTGEGVEVRESAEGPVLYAEGQCLDHPTKPVKGAMQWVERELRDPAIGSGAVLTVVGFGCGYHIEKLLQKHLAPIHVVEPSVAALKRACQVRDLRQVFERIASLSVDVSDPVLHEGRIVFRPQHFTLFPEMSATLRQRFYGSRGLSTLHPTVAVLGPFMGGSLPITTYTSRALAMMQQRMRHWDTSGFAGGLQELDKFVHEKHRKDILWANYVEMVSQVLIEAVNEKPIDVLVCMAQAPISNRALTELRKRGVITVLWFMEDYLRFTYWRDVSKYYDFVFTIQKGECEELIRKAGAGEVHYLPMAADPGIHIPLSLSPQEREQWGSRVSFVGAGYHNRQQMFAALAEYPFKIWGTEWPECKPFDKLVQAQGRRLSPEEYVKIFNATDINLNLHSSTERDGVDPFGDFVNPRTFELAACEAFQLVDERSHLNELYTPGEELVTFSSLPDLKDKMHYYLDRPEERRRISRKGRERTLRDHTYERRVGEMLRVIYGSRYEQLKARADASPWHRMLDRTKDLPELHERCQRAFSRGEEPNLDGLVSDIVTGHGRLSETEQKLMFLYHVRKQIIRMKREESGEGK